MSKCPSIGENFHIIEQICAFKPKIEYNNFMSRDLNVDQIKKLWILDLVIRTGSLKQAAIQAKISPSAISQRSRRLSRAMEGH
ncbi:MAG: hypothetical protein IPK04_09275 [Bdellovibrionales bacterium]|nr:hypothetical protein [Bdellovibrionales bacterium]